MAAVTYTRTSPASLSHYGRPKASYAVSLASPSSPLPQGAINEKEHMQELNSRLATYLEMVSKLEKTNTELELKIRERISEGKPRIRDYSKQFEIIETLRRQIAESVDENTKLLLAIDNTKLATEDFKVKWSSESAIRQSVEGDIGSLVSVRNNHQSINEGLRYEVEILQNELLALKKQHEQDLAVLRESLAKGKVSVEVDAVQGPDLNSILAEIRSQYEDIMKKNKEEADVLFQSQSEALSVQVEQEDRAVKSAQDELRDKRSLLQELQLSLETLNNQVNTLSGNVQDTELRYRAELETLQSHVTQLEKELADAARNMQNNKLQYEALLRIKETLEAEIAEYRRLLEGEPQEKVIIPEPKQPDIRTKKIVKIVTQTLVDGKIVGESSEVEEFENAEKSKANLLNIAVPRGSQ